MSIDHEQFAQAYLRSDNTCTEIAVAFGMTYKQVGVLAKKLGLGKKKAPHRPGKCLTAQPVPEQFADAIDCGLTVSQLATYFDVSVRQIQTWQQQTGLITLFARAQKEARKLDGVSDGRITANWGEGNSRGKKPSRFQSTELPFSAQAYATALRALATPRTIEDDILDTQDAYTEATR